MIKLIMALAIFWLSLFMVKTLMGCATAEDLRGKMAPVYGRRG